MISRCNEVALFVEFNHDGSVVADNIIDTAAHGIKIVNFDVGGRLSQCTGNVVRNMTGYDAEGLPLSGGILCDADVIVANNLVDVAKEFGIRLGWGPYGRNLQASNNTLMACKRGIEFSLGQRWPLCHHQQYHQRCHGRCHHGHGSLEHGDGRHGAGGC